MSRVTVMALIAERDSVREAARREAERLLKMLAVEVDRLPSGLVVPVMQMLSNEMKAVKGTRDPVVYSLAREVAA